jgi:HK97 family phage portal protein
MAKSAGTPFFGMPPGHALKAIGIDPDKGQMTEARLFQIQEIARLYGLPPVFLQDLAHGTFSNTEQQDLQLVKHNIGQRAKEFEDELNLKLFGQRRRARFVRHNLDGLQRGSFKERIEGFGLAIQTAQMTPDEVRVIEDRPPKEHGDKLYIQGATVPLGTQPVLAAPNDNTGGSADAAAQD